MREERIEIPGGELWHFPEFLSPSAAADAMEQLQSEVCWEQHRVKIAGREIPCPRLSAWYGDPGASYRYSGASYDPKPWTARLASLRDRLRGTLSAEFNSVLLNLYRDGADGMGWHSDDERELGDAPIIASISLGGPRRFKLRHRGGASVASFEPVAPLELELGSGSLLVMAGTTQANWRHSVPKTKRVVRPRINLTYRVILRLGASEPPL
jgi:alkylated DNA repair dioxygenase AlkB